MLQESLGGNSKTALIICCAAEVRHASETISTLRFGERAKRIKNHVHVNEELGVAELKALLERHSPADALAALDEALGTAGRYACVAALRLHTGSAEIVNAGLPPIALVRGGDVIASVSGSGYPPGLVGDARYRATVLPVKPGDRIVVLSDGLTEPFGHADAIENPLARLALFEEGPCAVLGASDWEKRLGEGRKSVV